MIFMSAAVEAVEAAGVAHEVVRHGPAGSLEEAARNQGVEVRDVVKTLVVRRADDDFLFVLVPGGRSISWPKLRALLGVKRLSLPDAATAKAATGYERGTITPFGASAAWPVIADETTRGRVIIWAPVSGAWGCGWWPMTPSGPWVGRSPTCRSPKKISDGSAPADGETTSIWETLVIPQWDRPCSGRLSAVRGIGAVTVMSSSVRMR
jgi:Cys-tRNA(Pro)/Cys-tRNA(Cys) deacylase